MLDLYHIPDKFNSPDSPNEKNYIGSIYLEEFKHLQDWLNIVKLKGIYWTFFKDTRLKRNEVEILLITIKEYLERNRENLGRSIKDYEKVILFFTMALKQNNGIICYCD